MSKFYIDILDIDNFVSRFNIKEVKSSGMYNGATSEPHPEGILSYNIFGEPGTPDRKYLYGYINLNAKFIHPKVYASLISLKREIFRDIINGVGAFTVESGEIKRIVTENNEFNTKKGEKIGTGIDFLYSIWDELDFKTDSTTAQQTKETKNFLGILKKSDIFITKWLIIPAFYRDIDLNVSRRNEYNVLYIRLIELASMVKANSLMFSLYSTTDAHKKIQNTINEFYNLFVIQKLGGTKGFVQENVIGKTTDYAARMVASAADFNYQNVDEVEVNYTHIACPLYVAIKTFLPFIAYEIRNFFRNMIGPNKFIYQYDTKTKNVDKYEIDPTYLEMLSIKNLQKRIDIYSTSRTHRIMPVTIKVMEDKKEFPIFFFDGETILNSENYIKKVENSNNITSDLNNFRSLNWTELFYMMAYNALKNKMAYITRYPIETSNSMFPNYINVIPTRKYFKKELFGEKYPRFPDFSEIRQYKDYRDVPISKLNSLFPDTLRIHPSYMSALGLDFDGSITTLKHKKI